eukprot:scaffold56791_cov61-Cyclotella_meneghiniana.AAC.1
MASPLAAPPISAKRTPETSSLVSFLPRLVGYNRSRDTAKAQQPEPSGSQEDMNIDDSGYSPMAAHWWQSILEDPGQIDTFKFSSRLVHLHVDGIDASPEDYDTIMRDHPVMMQKIGWTRPERPKRVWRVIELKTGQKTMIFVPTLRSVAWMPISKPSATLSYTTSVVPTPKTDQKKMPTFVKFPKTSHSTHPPSPKSIQI